MAARDVEAPREVLRHKAIVDGHDVRRAGPRRSCATSDGNGDGAGSGGAGGGALRILSASATWLELANEAIRAAAHPAAPRPLTLAACCH